jgi:hypothetical protein
LFFDQVRQPGVTFSDRALWRDMVRGITDKGQS